MEKLYRRSGLLASGAMLVAVAGCHIGGSDKAQEPAWLTQSMAELLDKSDGKDWPGYGRTYGEQHFSPLTEINGASVGKLGLAWSMDLSPGQSVTQPLEVNGVFYFTTGLSKIHAVNSVTGTELWMFDPKVPDAPGRSMRLAWGSRGIAWWKGKIYTATQDGRLIALDAATGRPIWSVMTIGADDGRSITGAPRVFDGKVIIGHGGADVASIRGYVTTYDAETGKQLWRWFAVPGNPALDRDETTQIASKTWAGQWWKYGGGGTAWNAMSYDPDTRTVFIGTGNGAPWNYKIRSEGRGDNLFLCSVVALDANTGKYKWHYQFNPGESWDYNAVMDMEFADLPIGTRQRKVLITAPKNGFVYVIDRVTGQFISAKPFVKVTWARGIDANGRPIEAPNSKYENGPFLLSPSSQGGHNWLPMAFSPSTGLVYIPAIEQDAVFSDAGIDIKHWQRPPNFQSDGGVRNLIKPHPGKSEAALVAWDPTTQKQVWRVPMPANVSGGVLATAGNLVFQGGIDGHFYAYDAKTGKVLWSYDTKAPVMAPPISYSVGGKQYISVLTGAGSSLVLVSKNLERFGISYRDQRRRVLTFALGGTKTLPYSPPYVFKAVDDAEYRRDAKTERRGEYTYDVTCLTCHGLDAIGSGVAPDLRASSVILSADGFDSIVRGGALVEQGMPRFNDLSPQTISDIRQFVRLKAAEARKDGH